MQELGCDRDRFTSWFIPLVQCLVQPLSSWYLLNRESVVEQAGSLREVEHSLYVLLEGTHEFDVHDLLEMAAEPMRQVIQAFWRMQIHFNDDPAEMLKRVYELVEEKHLRSSLVVVTCDLLQCTCCEFGLELCNQRTDRVVFDVPPISEGGISELMMLVGADSYEACAIACVSGCISGVEVDFTCPPNCESIIMSEKRAIVQDSVQGIVVRINRVSGMPQGGVVLHETESFPTFTTDGAHVFLMKELVSVLCRNSIPTEPIKYWSYVRRRLVDGQQWYKCIDGKVLECDWQHISQDQHNAYMLFYSPDHRSKIILNRDAQRWLARAEHRQL